MSTGEEQELLAQINRLEGRISKHKAQQTAPSHSRGTFRAAPYHRGGGYRGSRGQAPTYRNKTLVLNGQNGQHRDATANSNAAGSGSWVSRTDRHLQLINSSVFEKDSQARASAIEETQRLKRLQKEQAEKNRFLNYVQQYASSAAPTSPSTPASRYEITVEGIRFQITKQGSKLVRAPDDNNPPSATPRITLIGGVKFYRTKHGNLVRHGIAKAQRWNQEGQYTMQDLLMDRYCLLPQKRFITKPPEHAIFWHGSCIKGPNCRFVHDPAKVAICRDWLFKSDCPNGDACDLVHETTEERTPLCMHFANGKCHNDSCPYVHAEHSQTDPVCRDFGFNGYCGRGAKCPDRHVFECPDFSNTGICKTKGCKLLHRERASVLRSKAGNNNDEDMADLSSDEDEGAAPDDIDSDEVEEFIGHDDVDELDFDKDYIRF
ncbi:putative C3H1-type domain-containing protein [Seiridium cardinale]